jgi:hypothetical protein
MSTGDGGRIASQPAPDGCLRRARRRGRRHARVGSSGGWRSGAQRRPARSPSRRGVKERAMGPAWRCAGADGPGLRSRWQWRHAAQRGRALSRPRVRGDRPAFLSAGLATPFPSAGRTRRLPRGWVTSVRLECAASEGESRPNASSRLLLRRALRAGDSIWARAHIPGERGLAPVARDTSLPTPPSSPNGVRSRPLSEPKCGITAVTGRESCSAHHPS